MKNPTYCVIMAGGVGARFWPYSTSAKPKQFLDFFGTGRTLLQMTIDRFRPIVPIENVLVVTSVQYRDLVLEQVPDICPEHILCEPCRRNTAPCIAYAVTHIKAILRREQGSIDNDELQANMIVAPSDHLILQEENFRQVIKEGLQFVENNESLLTLGMRPVRPETGYGYIQVGNGNGALHKVKTFTEKPDLELAKQFLKSGEFLWNSGIFLWNLRAIRYAFIKYVPEVVNVFRAGEELMQTADEERYIQDMFPKCPNISIDYGVMEKAENVYVMSADFGWSDLGTWGSVYALSEKDKKENVTLHGEVIFYDSERNVVTLPKGKIAVIQGLDGYIVAESEQALLICRQEEEQQIRQFVNDAQLRFDGKYN